KYSLSFTRIGRDLGLIMRASLRNTVFSTTSDKTRGWRYLERIRAKGKKNPARSRPMKKSLSKIPPKKAPYPKVMRRVANHLKTPHRKSV
ncbi:uncharacterized protein METZ01_LOCUS468298, partial [marine metagenome]